MSVVRLPRGLTAVTTVAVGLFVAAPVPAQAPRKNDARERLNAVSAQKTEADVRTALLQAQNLAARDPAKAAERLQATIVQLEDNTSLTQERREHLTALLRRRIEALKSAPAEPALTEADLQAKIHRFENRKDQEQKNDEDANLRKKLAEVLDLQKNGKPAEAKRAAEELTKQYPGHPAAQNALLTAAAFDQLASAREIRKEKTQRFGAALNDVDRSAMPPIGDIEFPKDWKEKSERRKMYAAPRLSARERAILQALNSPVTVNFKEEKFQEVLEYLSTLMGQSIVMTRADLNDASISYETPVTLNVKGVAARTVLRKVLGEFGLTYVIKDESIQVVPLSKARELMVVRTYYIGDLMGVRGGPGDPLTNLFGPGLGQVAAMQNIASVIEMIQTSVDPSSWQINNGPGAVYFHFPSMSLVVKQSAEVHNMIASGLLR